jgi:hypothetical protein
MKLLRYVSSLLVALAFTASAHSAQIENLLPEGEMIGSPGSPPRGWQAPHANWLQVRGASIALEKDAQEPGNYVAFTNTDGKQLIRLQAQLEVKPAWVGRNLAYRLRVRGTEIGSGAESWHLAGLMLYYTDDQGKQRYSPGRLQLDVPTPQWRRLTGRWTVTPDAKILHIDIGLLGATGNLQIRDVELFFD